MKATGIIRRIDDLGRIVIPKEIRRTLRLRDGEAMEIFTDNGAVCFKKYNLMTEYTSTAEAMVKALKKQGIECALYDNSDCKVCGDRNAPAEMEYDAFNPNFFAINIDGDFCGYLAVAEMTPTDKPLIEFAVSMLAHAMRMD